jgi:hypothetical protein
MKPFLGGPEMKSLLGTLALLVVLALPAVAQQGRLSPDDQREFDKYYTKWVNDTRKNDQDDIQRDVQRMQDIMARNSIPLNVPFDQIASSGHSPNAYPNSSYPAYRANSEWHGRLSADDQREFDKYYQKWISDTRSNDRDDIGKDVGHMQEIMVRNHIPESVPFAEIASQPYASAYPNEPYGNSNYPSGTYSANGPWQGRLSPDDQHEFDKAYSKWLKDTRKNDRDDIDKDVRHMQDIMAHYNIPANVPFDQIASPDASNRY